MSKNHDDSSDQGATVEYSLTVEHKIKGKSHWPKVGVTLPVRPGETLDEAGERAVEWVSESMVNIIDALG